jgi:opacity protein-like surface antigen
MRKLILATVLTALLGATSSVAAQDRGFVQGFGSLQLEDLSSINPSFGAVIGASLVPNIQVIGEGGRIGNVLPSNASTLLAFSPVGFGVSAWYGQGGVRFTTSGSAVRPYAEASAGIARLQTDLRGLDGNAGAIADFALPFLDRTEPIATIGGGLTIGAGPVMADVGYRYRRVFSSSRVDTLAFGDSLHTSEVRLGLGVRF